ncbi:DUF4433 domain-containing protein [Candidatus Saccharibacteria bacterium]|nr:DUF4433 domain-containing protein [Candidatus Saccharibacteria bacterium]
MILKVYHITVLENLRSIKKYGILSRADAEKLTDFISIADPEVEANHRKLMISDGKIERPVDQYARCFFNPLPPMFHNRIKTHKNLCVLEIHMPVEEVKKYGKIFHNPKITGARFPVILKEGLTWNRNREIKSIITHNLDYVNWDDSKDALDKHRNGTLAKRSAEMLIYPKIPFGYIKRAFSNYPKHRPLKELEKISSAGRPQIDGR